jgi:ornithine cyclodeaminase/alanine dehydrogenase-like protein (mu-crystallin family)
LACLLPLSTVALRITIGAIMLMINEATAGSLLDLAGVRQCVRAALEQQAANRVKQSDPRSQFLKSEEHNNRYHIKGAYLRDDLVAGFRVREFTHVPARSDEMQLILLSDLETAAFLGIVSCDQLSERRFGAMAALTIEALARQNASTLAVVGAGALARAGIQAIQEAVPFSCIRVASRSPESRKALCAGLSEEGLTGIEPADSIEAACHEADVILTITNAEAPLVHAAWCKPGSLLVSTGGRRECEPEAVLDADQVFIDDWEQCAALGELAALHREGHFGPGDVTATLAQVITGRHPGRRSEEDRIVAVPQGLTSLDVALAHFVYRAAVEKNLGIEVEWP